MMFVCVVFWVESRGSWFIVLSGLTARAADARDAIFFVCLVFVA